MIGECNIAASCFNFDFLLPKLPFTHSLIPKFSILMKIIPKNGDFHKIVNHKILKIN